MLSFSAGGVLEKLKVPPGRDGAVWFHDEPRRTHQMHRHIELEFNLVERGAATYLLGEQRHDLRPGTLMWLFPAQDHVLLDKSPDFAMWIAVFTPEACQRLCSTEATAPLRASDPPVRFAARLAHPDLARVTALLRDLFENNTRSDMPRFNAGLGYLLLSAWDAHRRASDAPAGAGVHPAVERAVRLLRDKETEPLSASDLARQTGLSASRLGRLFFAQTGVSLTAFRNRQRIERFLQRYERQRTTLLEAALASGFGSYAQFHRVFKNVMGYAPADLRRAAVHPPTTPPEKKQ